MGSLYYYYKEHGICVMCGSSDAMEGHTRCPECSYKEAERQRIRRNTDAYRAKKRDYNKKYYYEKKSKGICTVCKRPTFDGQHKCPSCLNRARKNQAKRRAKNGHITREQKKALGICIRCTKNHALYGKTICQDCYDLLVKQAHENLHPAVAEIRAKKKEKVNA